VNPVPEDLDRAVRDVARHLPAQYATLTEITTRGRRMRRRRTAAVGSIAALAVLGGALGVPVVVKRAEGRTAPQPAASATTSPSPTPSVGVSPRTWTTAAQRLLLNGSTASVTHSDGSTAGVDGPTTTTELLPTGKVRAVKVPSYNGGVVDPVLLTSGGLVGLGIQNLQPGVPRPDGPDVTGLEIRLVVIRPDGSTASKRNVRIQGEYVDLLAADDKSAVLWRKHGVFLRDLATGDEQRLPAASTLAGGNVGETSPHGKIGAVSLTAQAIAIVQEGHCPTVQIGGLVTGTPHALKLPGEPSRCGVGDMRFSPDGTSLAVAYGPIGAEKVRLAVFDTATGALVSDSALYSAPDPLGMLEAGTPDLRGIAWMDDRTVRAAVTTLPPGAKRTYRYTELLRVVDIQVR
jgi:hypothetical protein